MVQKIFCLIFQKQIAVAIHRFEPIVAASITMRLTMLTIQHRRRTRIMDGVLDLVAVLIFDNFGSNKQQFEPRNTDGVGRKCFHRNLIRWLVQRDHQFHIPPDVIGQHHHLKEGVVVFKAEGIASNPSRLASPTRFSTSARLSYWPITSWALALKLVQNMR